MIACEVTPSHPGAVRDIAKGTAFVTATDDPGKKTRDDFVVAVSDYGQHALWRADSALPDGWRRQSAAMSRHACLDAIAAAWPDIAPASVRAVAAGGTVGRPARAGRDGAHPARPFVHEMVAGQASLRPDATAVVAAGTRLTYRELDQSANRLARYLAGLGAGPETVIGVHLGRGAEAIRGLLAIMKAGCGYLPLDPSLPPARLARMCAEARPAAILTGRADEKLPIGRDRLLVAGALDLARQPDTAPWPARSGRSRASTRSRPGTGWRSSPRSPSTPRSSRCSSR